MLPFSIHEYGPRAHQCGHSDGRKHSTIFGSRLVDDNPPDKPRILVANGKPLTAEGRKLLLRNRQRPA